MALLKNLKVDKVSFVQRPANKRKFLVLKSADLEDDLKGTQKGKVVTTKKGASTKGEIKRMDAKLKELLKSLVAAHKSVDEVMKALGESKDVELSEDATSAAKDVVELMMGMKPLEKKVEKKVEKKTVAPVVPAPPVIDPAIAAIAKKQQKDLEKALERTTALEKKLAATEKRTAIEEIRREVDAECPHFAGDAAEAASYLYDLRKSDKKAAEFFMNTLKASSVIAESPELFTEIGKSGEADLEASQILGSNFLLEIKKAKDALAKSGVQKSEVEIITDAVRGVGGDSYQAYRQAQIRRAKRA